MISGLYAIAPQTGDDGLLVQQVEAALAGGARIVQYRDKSVERSRRRAQAGALRALCRRHGALFIVNDDIDLASEVGADGVHLGREDAAIEAARARLGAGRLIGASCYGELERAIAAQRAGADYVAFGSVFPSPTKPGAPRVTLSLFAQARARIALPLVAIGGITLSNAAQVIAAGADAIAVVSALFEAHDVRAAAAALSALFRDEHPTQRASRGRM